MRYSITLPTLELALNPETMMLEFDDKERTFDRDTP